MNPKKGDTFIHPTRGIECVVHAVNARGVHYVPKSLIGPGGNFPVEKWKDVKKT